jgi:hypothetical protein
MPGSSPCAVLWEGKLTPPQERRSSWYAASICSRASSWAVVHVAGAGGLPKADLASKRKRLQVLGLFQGAGGATTPRKGLQLPACFGARKRPGSSVPQSESEKNGLVSPQESSVQAFDFWPGRGASVCYFTTAQAYFYCLS